MLFFSCYFVNVTFVRWIQLDNVISDSSPLQQVSRHYKFELPKKYYHEPAAKLYDDIKDCTDMPVPFNWTTPAPHTDSSVPSHVAGKQDEFRRSWKTLAEDFVVLGTSNKEYSTSIFDNFTFNLFPFIPSSLSDPSSVGYSAADIEKRLELFRWIRELPAGLGLSIKIITASEIKQRGRSIPELGSEQHMSYVTAMMNQRKLTENFKKRLSDQQLYSYVMKCKIMISKDAHKKG